MEYQETSREAYKWSETVKGSVDAQICRALDTAGKAGKTDHEQETGISQPPK